MPSRATPAISAVRKIADSVRITSTKGSRVRISSPSNAAHVTMSTVGCTDAPRSTGRRGRAGWRRGLRGGRWRCGRRGLRGPRRDPADGDLGHPFDQHPVTRDPDELNPVVHEDGGTELQLVFGKEGFAPFRRDHLHLPIRMVLPESFRDLLDPAFLEVLDRREEGDCDHVVSRAYRSAAHKACARHRGRKTMRPARLPACMRFLVASEGDQAGVHQREELLRLASWTKEEPFGSRAAWRLRDMILLTIPELHLHRDHLDRDLESSFNERVDLVVYLSKHRSESGRPSLTVHPIGNPGPAEFGGQPETLVPSAPRWMTAALRGLRHTGRALGYEVTFEATHHGPYLTSPTFFIEQGSTEREWVDREASRAIARALLDLRPLEAPIAIGLGGGHYVPRHTDVALRRRIAFGHLLATYALAKASPGLLEQAVERPEGETLAYLHRKALSKPEVRDIEQRLERLGLRIVREADLPSDREDETS